MKTLLLLLLCTLSAQAQLTLRSAAYVPLLKPAAVGGGFNAAAYGNVVFWFDGDYYNTTTGVATDRGANGFNLGQATSGYRPTTNIVQNGHFGILFDGTDDYLTNSGIKITVTNFSVVMVVGEVTGRSKPGILTFMPATSANDYSTAYGMVWVGNQGADKTYAYGNNAYVFRVTDANVLPLAVWAFSLGATASDNWLMSNGVPVVATTGGGLFNSFTNGITLGARQEGASIDNFGNIKVFTAITYTNSLSSNTLFQVSTNLKSVYGL